MNISNAILINYKTWILYISCSIIICDYNILDGLYGFTYAYLMCYFIHYLIHIDIFHYNMFSIIHTNHHDSNTLFAFITNCVTEFLLIINIIVLKYINDIFKIVNLFFINEWIMFFIYFFYTTVHNINYTMLKVNKYHYQHHQISNTNLGPDIFDLLFGTKNKNTIENEQVDHYIPNILLSFIVIILFKKIYDYDKKKVQNIFTIIWILSIIFIWGSSIYFLKEKIDTILLEETNKFEV